MAITARHRADGCYMDATGGDFTSKKPVRFATTAEVMRQLVETCGDYPADECEVVEVFWVVCDWNNTYLTPDRRWHPEPDEAAHYDTPVLAAVAARRFGMDSKVRRRVIPVKDPVVTNSFTINVRYSADEDKGTVLARAIDAAMATVGEVYP